MLKKKLVSGCQLTTYESTYWWQGNIEPATEYHLEMHSKKSLYPEIEKTIRFLHDYETAEISYHEIKGSAEFLNWIQSETTN